MNKVTLLWSGGWDGTFRFLELMQHEDIEIQPIYVIDPGRESTPYDMKGTGFYRTVKMKRSVMHLGI